MGRIVQSVQTHIHGEIVAKKFVIFSETANQNLDMVYCRNVKKNTL